MKPGSHFAIEFYKHLFSGVCVGQAVLNARHALVDLYGEETIIWASYVFYGDPTFNYMDQIEVKSPEISEQKSAGYLKPAIRDRTREEVIDFKKWAQRPSVVQSMAGCGGRIATGDHRYMGSALVPDQGDCRAGTKGSGALHERRLRKGR